MNKNKTKAQLLAEIEHLQKLASACNSGPICGAPDDKERCRRAEEALKESEKKFRAFAAAATDAIVHINEKGEIAFWNKAAERMFGYSFEEVAGKEIHFILAPPELRDSYRKGLSKFQKSGSGPVIGKTLEMQAVGKNGKNFPIEISTSSIRIGGKWHAVSIIRDISERKSAEKALKNSNELLEKIFSGIHLLIAYMDRDFNFIKVNNAYAEADGRTPEFFPGKNHFELYPNDDNRAIFNMAMETGDPYYAFEKPFVYADPPERGVKYWDWSLTPVKGPDGKANSLVLCLLDVTERKKAEESLRESESKFRGIFNAVFQFIGLLEPDGKVIEINRTALDFAGIRPEDVIDKYFWDTKWWSIAPDAGQRVREAVSEASRGNFVRYEAEILGADGKKATIDFSIKPVEDEYGNIKFLIPEGRDISGLKKMEEISRNRDFISSVLNSVGVLVSVLDSQGRIVSLNREAERTTGHLLDEVRGLDFAELFLVPGDQGPARQYFKNIASGNFPSRYESRIKTKKGGLRLISWSNALIPDPDGNVRFIISTGVDITERQQMEAELRKYREHLEDVVRERTDEFVKSNELLKEEIKKRVETEEFLRESQMFVQRIADSSPNILYLYDVAEHRNLYSNSQMFNILGYTPEKIKAMGAEALSMLVPPEDQPAVLESRKRLMRLKDGEVLESESRMRTASGQLRWFRSSEVVFSRDPDGRPRQILGTAQDITEKKQAQERLRLFRILIEQSNDAVFVIEPVTGRFLDFNDKACTSLEYTREELAKLGVCDVATFASTDAEWKKYASRIMENGYLIAEGEQVRKDGTAFPVELNIKYISHENREYLVAVVRDITERKIVEKALLEREERFRKIFEEGPIGMAIADLSQRYLKVNPAFCRMMGYSEQELTSFHISKITHPDDIEPDLELLKKLNSGEIPYFQLEKRYVKKDGGFLWGNLTVSIVRDSNGKPLYYIGMVEDISERKKAEEENSRLAAAVESSEDAIVITGLDGAIQYVNPAFEKITGFPKNEALGMCLDSFVSKEGPGLDLKEIFRTGTGWRGLVSNRKKDGTVYTEEITIAPVTGPRGGIRNFVAIKRDVTEKLRLESIAEAVNTMNSVGYIFSGIRHEIGNPVNSLKMTLSVLRNRLEGSSRHVISEYIERAMNEISRLEYILKALKSFNMYETPELKKIDMASFFDNFYSLVADDFGKKGIKIFIDVMKGAESGYADPRALQQVLMNIITNAADALNDIENPRIEIKVMQMANRIMIHVADNGCGMTEKQLKELFRPFYTTKTHGTGLGLMIAKKMISKMQGTIEITSQKDAGTAVDIFIPEGAN